MNRGFVIMAQNTATTDYQHCAQTLKASINRLMPNEQVTIITEQELPYGDQATDSNWKLINDWQVYWASPYDYTIKLEADMILTRPIDHWWTVLQNRDLNICTTIRDFKGNISNNKSYRKIFVESGLPNVYNAVTYFKKSPVALEFYALVKDIFENWSEYKQLLKYCPDEVATTDVVYGIASRIIGEKLTTLPSFTAMSMCHMKPRINNSRCEYWPDEFTYEISKEFFRINSFTQQFPVHYHVKEFSKTIEMELAHD